MAARSSRVVGRRIRAARERRGLTQADVAAALGRTPTSISYWENGQRAPGLDDIVALGRLLGVEPATLLPSQPPRVLARAQAAELAIDDLAGIVDDLIDHFEPLATPAPMPAFPSSNPVEVAGAARRAAGQDTAPISVEAVMTLCNVRFTIRPMPEGLSGLVVVVSDSPVIAVRSQDNPRRRRFSFAHELGHVLLGHHDTFHVDFTRAEGFPPDYNWRHERAANDFGAALLMPAALVREDIENIVPLDVRDLSKRYEVSEQAMSIRLSSLGIRLGPDDGETLF